MDSCLKLHHPQYHEVNAKKLLQDYYSQHAPQSVFRESAINMMKCFYDAFSSGLVSGKNLIDIGFGPTIIHLISSCEFFEEISILNFNSSSIKELELWKNKDPEAFDWSHISKLSMDLKGISSDGSEDVEENLREKIKQILKWDFCKDNPGDVLSLPNADCVISAGSLELISKDHDDYRRNLRKFSNLINLGGYLLLCSPINASYIRFGEDTFHFLRCDESFHKRVISEEGFEIKHCEKFNRVKCTDAIDHEGGVFIIAHKVKEP